MAAAAATESPPAPPTVGPSSSQDYLPRPVLAISSDSEALRRSPERCETESEAFVDPVLLPTLEGLLQEVYTSLRPKPVDYERRQLMVAAFNKIAEQIFGKNNGLPVVVPFGSFMMDLFTAESDLDLSVNFNNDVKAEFPRKEKISAIRRLAKVLHDHQRNGRCYGVLPVVHAIVPVLKVTDQETGVECDISVENKDGMSRSVIYTFVSSIDERFRILCYLMKFWAKSHGINSPKDRTISSMAIISLVAFHLQTRQPPILPAFSAILKDSSDSATIERNVSLYKGFGSGNKESVAELFVSLMSKLVSVEGKWEQGLCASIFEGSWISKTWDRGVGNLSVEDFMDRSQNFARSVGKEEMHTICECLRVTVSNLSSFFMGKVDAPRLKALLFGPFNQDKPNIINVIHRHAKRKRVNPNKRSNGKNGKKKKLDQDKPAGKNGKRKKLDQDKPLTSTIREDSKKSTLRPDSISSHVKNSASGSRSQPPTVFIPPRMHLPVPTHPSTQFPHIPQPLIHPSLLVHGLPQPQLHPAYHHPYQGFVGQPQINFIHFNSEIQQQYQGQVMFAPSAPHRPVMYGINGAQRMQHYDNRFVQRPPYGFGPSL